MSFRVMLVVLASLVWGMVSGTTSFTDAEVQVVRSVLERQNTLLGLHALALTRETGKETRQVAVSGSDLHTQNRQMLLATAQRLGMRDVEGLSPPAYFAQAMQRLKTLKATDFDREYLLLALQCHAFLERAVNAQLRITEPTPLREWARAYVTSLEPQSRNIDHALYALK